MGSSLVLFDVSIGVSSGQFHCANKGHTNKNKSSPWENSFPVSKTATIISHRIRRSVCILEIDLFEKQLGINCKFEHRTF